MFASDDGLGLLGDADTWFMDGTHSTAPAQFAQLFCIRVPLGETCVSAAYALLPAKNQYDIRPSNTSFRYKAKSLDHEKIGYSYLHLFGQRSHHYHTVW